MKILEKKFNDVFLLKPKLNLDQRGFFSEIYNKNDLNKALKKKNKFNTIKSCKIKKYCIKRFAFSKR